MKMNSKKGFTLIELLVVVAIIGVLASVVLASLNTARTKGANAALKSNLANIRAAAEMQYDTMGCYSNTGTACAAAAPAAVAAAACPASAAANIFGFPGIAAQIAAATSAGGSLNTCTSTVAGTAWAVAVIQKGATAAAADSGWCVDSTGKSKSITVTTLDRAGIDAETAAGVCAE